MFKNRKWFALLLAVCMMVSLMPAANMEENSQIEAANSISNDIESPDPIQDAVDEIHITLGGEAPQAPETTPAEDTAPESSNTPAGDVEGADAIEGANAIEGADAIEGEENTNTTTAPEAAPASDNAVEPASTSEETASGDDDAQDNTEGGEDIDEEGAEEESSVEDADMATSTKGPKIKTQPKSFMGAIGKTASFTVKLSNTKNVKYVWQYHKPGATSFKSVPKSWTVKVNKAYTHNTATMKIKLTKARNGYVFRCRVTRTKGSDKGTTDSYEVTMGTSMIKTQPKDKETKAATSSKKLFTVKASGSSLKYQWQTYNTAKKKWVNGSGSAYKKASLKIKPTASLNGTKFRCKITDGSGITLYSKTVTLTIPNPDDSPVVIDNVKYEMKDNVMTVVGYDKEQTKYVVQETVNGQTVKAIGEGAFKDNKKLEEIDLPDTIEVIGKQAFMNCANLSSMS